MPAPKCIETAHLYSPIGLLLLKLIKPMDQRQCVTATPYVKKKEGKTNKIALMTS